MSRSFLVLAFFFALAVAPSAMANESPDLKGTWTEVDGVGVLRLWGTPRERGFAHGWLLARDIVDGADRSLSAFLGSRMPLYETMMLPLAKTAFTFSEEEREELQGILDGLEARLPETSDRTITSLGRPPRMDDLLLVNVFGDLYALGCSSLAVWGSKTEGDETLVVRNFDFPALDLVAARQHVRIVAPREGALGYVGVSHPGGIGMLTGMNAEGVFAAIHDVHVTPGMEDLAQKNVPRLVAIRRLLEQVAAEGAVEKAAALCRSWNTLYGNNIMVATSKPGDGLFAGILEYDTREKDDEGVDLRRAAADEEHVVCTNHHRVRGSGSCWRYDTLTGACRDDDPALVTVEELFALAGRISFPEPDEKIEQGALATLHQVVGETAARRLHVRTATFGENIRTRPTLDFDVSRELDALAGK
jgi:hypothetical protein